MEHPSITDKYLLSLFYADKMGDFTVNEFKGDTLSDVTQDIKVRMNEELKDQFMTHEEVEDLGKNIHREFDMKNILRIVLCVIAVLALVGAVTSCGVGKDEEMIGGDTLSRDKVNFETDDRFEKNSGMVSEGRLYFHHSKTEALLVDSKGSLLWLYSENKSVFENFDKGIFR